MSQDTTSIDKGREVIRIEAEAVAALGSRIGENFAHAVDIISECTGRVIVTGVGKSGIIARKIVATMNSTGTPSVFLHPTDAVHGDLGIVREGDVAICISKSGNTAEMNTLLPVFKRVGVQIIALVGNLDSVLARESTVALDASVREEACPYDLAPTSSTTATLVLGDALAIALLPRRQFTREEFALYHPGGTLGRRLVLKIDELMVTGERVPRVTGDVPLRDAIVEMTSKRLGCTLVVDRSGMLEGIITDGDLRRLLQRESDISRLTAAEAMTRHPKTARQGSLAVLVLQEMEQYKITQMIVTDGSGEPVGIAHMHELVNAGLSEDETP
ncbi:MAG: KpsF/GutQ family sugar-phosphate isomerase [Bacteroidetes bacterium]|nr:KpsF/GutQ family sugar-phosphate isomerase [Bacteroidota bacterium]